MNCSKQLAEDIIKALFIFVLMLCLVSVEAQEKTPPQSEIKIDSTTIIKSSLSDTTKFTMKKSAWGSVLRSAVLPGFGQFNNESYWKVPLIWGVLGYLGYQWNSNNKSYKQYRDLYNASITPTNDGDQNYYDKREFYRDQRDMFAVFIGLSYFLNLVDAYVDAHLFDFDVEADVAKSNYQLSLKLKL